MLSKQVDGPVFFLKLSSITLFALIPSDSNNNHHSDPSIVLPLRQTQSQNHVRQHRHTLQRAVKSEITSWEEVWIL